MQDRSFEQAARALEEPQHGGLRRGRRFDPELHRHLHTIIERECYADLERLQIQFGCSSLGQVIEGLRTGFRTAEAQQAAKRNRGSLAGAPS